LAAASKASEEYGLQEEGCICQLLSEVSEALDAANDSCECNICLEVCGPSEPAVHPPCEHVFHCLCLGHWAVLKDAEAEEAALEAGSAARAERDALRREVAEAPWKEAAAAEAVEAVVLVVSRRMRRAEVLRARLKGPGAGSSEATEADLGDFGYLSALEEGEEMDAAYLDKLLERLREAKACLQRAQADERRVAARGQESGRRLQVLEGDLATAARVRASASLPCPVCRAPIDRSVFKACVAASASSAIAGGAGGKSSVSALPEALRKQVRRVQEEQNALLVKRREREAEAEATASSSSAPPPSSTGAGAGGGGPSGAAAAPGSTVHAGRGDEEGAEEATARSAPSGRGRGRGGIRTDGARSGGGRGVRQAPSEWSASAAWSEEAANGWDDSAGWDRGGGSWGDASWGAGGGGQSWGSRSEGWSEGGVGGGASADVAAGAVAGAAVGGGRRAGRWARHTSELARS